MGPPGTASVAPLPPSLLHPQSGTTHCADATTHTDSVHFPHSAYIQDPFPVPPSPELQTIRSHTLSSPSEEMESRDESREYLYTFSYSCFSLQLQSPAGLAETTPHPSGRKRPTTSRPSVRSRQSRPDTGILLSSWFTSSPSGLTLVLPAGYRPHTKKAVHHHPACRLAPQRCFLS